MSGQWQRGWFPECLVCGMGNVGPVICLDPTCHEAHQGDIIEGGDEHLVTRDGHSWKLCNWCAGPILADAGAWGTYALCVDCWNRSARHRTLPPASPIQMAKLVKRGAAQPGLAPDEPAPSE